LEPRSGRVNPSDPFMLPSLDHQCFWRRTR